MASKNFKPNADTKARGAYLREARERAGLSQQKVADAIGVSRATYNYFENGRQEEIPIVEAVKLQSALGVDPHFLLTPKQRKERTLLLRLGELDNLAAGAGVAEASPAWLKAQKLSSEAHTLALKFDAIPDIDDRKREAAALINAAFRETHRSYARWEDEMDKLTE